MVVKDSKKQLCSLMARAWSSKTISIHNRTCSKELDTVRLGRSYVFRRIDVDSMPGCLGFLLRDHRPACIIYRHFDDLMVSLEIEEKLNG